MNIDSLRACVDAARRTINRLNGDKEQLVVQGGRKKLKTLPADKAQLMELLHTHLGLLVHTANMALAAKASSGHDAECDAVVQAASDVLRDLGALAVRIDLADEKTVTDMVRCATCGWRPPEVENVGKAGWTPFCQECP